jgi:hypothetical protein
LDFVDYRHQTDPQTMLLIWDRLPGHRSRLVQCLPAYAPELNPSKHIWAHLKQLELACHETPTAAPVDAAPQNSHYRVSEAGLALLKTSLTYAKPLRMPFFPTNRDHLTLTGDIVFESKP